MLLASKLTALFFTGYSVTNAAFADVVGGTCLERCQEVFDDASTLNVCVDGCENGPAQFGQTNFDANFPYWFGPIPLVPELAFSGTGDDILGYDGQLYVRVDETRTKIQFMYEMNKECEDAAPYCPHFAMHLHSGSVGAGEPAGPVMISIAGTGPIVACIAPKPSHSVLPFDFTVCSETCTDSDAAFGNCVKVDDTSSCLACRVVLADAYFCPGGCAGDGRISGHAVIDPATGEATGAYEQIAPSRYCEMATNGDSNAPQNVWIQGKFSNEQSGNPDDAAYSPHSIGVLENFDQFCASAVPWLVEEVFAPGKASYVALHTDFNATGFSSLAVGDLFAKVSTVSGGPSNCAIFGSDMYSCESGIPEASIAPLTMAGSMRSRMDALEARLDAMEERLNARLDSIEERLSAYNSPRPQAANAPEERESTLPLMTINGAIKWM